VDDNPSNLSLLSAMLVERGYEVRAAINGAMALKAANAAPPDVILLDVSMPEMDGYEVCRRLKAEERTRVIPIIFISALDALRDKVAAFEAGGVDYVTKPFQLREVLARVGTQLLLHRQRKELERQRRELEERYLQIQQLQSSVKGYLSRRAWDSIVESASSDAPRPPARELLTILISDIEGFVRLSEQMAPGPLFADLSLYMALMTQVIYRHQGEVDKYLGDGILAFFKDPKSALTAAYHMQRRVLAFNDRQARSGRMPFLTRIGLSTGPVLLASIGTSGTSARREFTIIGDSVNLAARLQAESKTGGVLMDQATFAAAGSPSGAEPVVMQLRGKPDPATMYAVSPEVIAEAVPEEPALSAEEPSGGG
jgi:adenylate cyclase